MGGKVTDMPFFEMTEDLMTGNFMIDEQHKELIDRINDLHEAIESRRRVGEIDMVFKFLESYVLAHFGAEEKIMDKRDYPEKEEHKAKHAHFIKEFKKIENSFKLHMESGDGSTDDKSWEDARQMESLLKDWLINHIKTIDTKLGAFLAS